MYRAYKIDNRVYDLTSSFSRKSFVRVLNHLNELDTYQNHKPTVEIIDEKTCRLTFSNGNQWDVIGE